MSKAASSRPQVNGILETSLYVEHPTQSVKLYRRVFGFEPIDPDQKEGVTDQTRLCPMRAGDGSVLLLFKKGATANTNANGASHVAFGISRSELPAWGVAVAAGDYDGVKEDLEIWAQDLNKRYLLDTQMQSLWLPAIQGQLATPRPPILHEFAPR